MTFWSWPINNIHLTGCGPSYTVSPTDRGSNDGPWWSTVVCVRGWVTGVSIHGHRPRTVGLSVSQDLAKFSELVWWGVAVVNHGSPARAVRWPTIRGWQPWVAPATSQNLHFWSVSNMGCYKFPLFEQSTQTRDIAGVISIHHIYWVDIIDRSPELDLRKNITKSKGTTNIILHI